MREHASRLRTLDPGLIAGLQAGDRVPVPAKYRPAVVHGLLRLGWSETRIASVLNLEPLAVRSARVLAANAVLYAMAEAQAEREARTFVA
ncbi:hypothetical protein ACWGI8_42480 [Streptomyces sp. NPDC054841]